MDKELLTSAVEALLFASGKPVSIRTLSLILEQDAKDVEEALQNLKISLVERKSGLQLIKVNESYQLCTLEAFYDYICRLLDTRPKPSLSQAAFEVLSIIAYNPKITRAELEKIRGVSSDSAMSKLLEYNLIEEAGKQDLPGKPMGYQTTDEFLKMFGLESIKDLPELPKLKEELDQVNIDEVNEDTETIDSDKKENDSNEEDVVQEEEES